MTGKAFSKVLTFALVAMALILFLGLVSKYTNGFTTGFKTFYVTHNGQDIMVSKQDAVLPMQNKWQVDVNYTFVSEDSAVNDYNLRIIPNREEGKDFNIYTADGIFSFQAEEDYTEAFNITKSETGFTITPQGTLTDTLSAYFGTEINNCAEDAYDNMFILIVSSYNDSASVSIYFTVEEPVSGVELEQGVITFD